MDDKTALLARELNVEVKSFAYNKRCAVVAVPAAFVVVILCGTGAVSLTPPLLLLSLLLQVLGHPKYALSVFYSMLLLLLLQVALRVEDALSHHFSNLLVLLLGVSVLLLVAVWASLQYTPLVATSPASAIALERLLLSTLPLVSAPLLSWAFLALGGSPQLSPFALCFFFCLFHYVLMSPLPSSFVKSTVKRNEQGAGFVDSSRAGFASSSNFNRYEGMVVGVLESRISLLLSMLLPLLFYISLFHRVLLLPRHQYRHVYHCVALLSLSLLYCGSSSRLLWCFTASDYSAPGTERKYSSVLWYTGLTLLCFVVQQRVVLQSYGHLFTVTQPYLTVMLTLSLLLFVLPVAITCRAKTKAVLWALAAAIIASTLGLPYWLIPYCSLTTASLALFLRTKTSSVAGEMKHYAVVALGLGVALAYLSLRTFSLSLSLSLSFSPLTFFLILTIIYLFIVFIPAFVHMHKSYQDLAIVTISCYCFLSLFLCVTETILVSNNSADRQIYPLWMVAATTAAGIYQLFYNFNSSGSGNGLLSRNSSLSRSQSSTTAASVTLTHLSAAAHLAKLSLFFLTTSVTSSTVSSRNSATTFFAFLMHHYGHTSNVVSVTLSLSVYFAALLVLFFSLTLTTVTAMTSAAKAVALSLLFILTTLLSFAYRAHPLLYVYSYLFTSEPPLSLWLSPQVLLLLSVSLSPVLLPLGRQAGALVLRQFVAAMLVVLFAFFIVATVRGEVETVSISTTTATLLLLLALSLSLSILLARYRRLGAIAVAVIVGAMVADYSLPAVLMPFPYTVVLPTLICAQCASATSLALYYYYCNPTVAATTTQTRVLRQPLPVLLHLLSLFISFLLALHYSNSMYTTAMQSASAAATLFLYSLFTVLLAFVAMATTTTTTTRVASVPSSPTVPSGDAGLSGSTSSPVSLLKKVASLVPSSPLPSASTLKSRSQLPTPVRRNLSRSGESPSSASKIDDVVPHSFTLRQSQVLLCNFCTVAAFVTAVLISWNILQHPPWSLVLLLPLLLLLRPAHRVGSQHASHFDCSYLENEARRFYPLCFAFFTCLSLRTVFLGFEPVLSVYLQDSGAVSGAPRGYMQSDAALGGSFDSDAGHAHASEESEQLLFHHLLLFLKTALLLALSVPLMLSVLNSLYRRGAEKHSDKGRKSWPLSAPTAVLPLIFGQATLQLLNASALLLFLLLSSERATKRAPQTDDIGLKVRKQL